MELRYVRLTKKDRGFFRFLDPYEKLRVLSLPFGFAMGALLEEGDKLIPVGLLVASVSDESFITEWLAVSLDHQWSGIGEGLLYRAFKIASDLGLETVQAVFLPEYEKEIALKHAKIYFEERLFKKKIEAGADVYMMLADIKTSEGTKDCKILSDMTSRDRGRCLEKLSRIDNATYTFSPSLLLPGLDNDISVVCQNKNTIEGGLLTCVADDCIYPLYHYARSEDVSESLIATAVAAANKKYGRNMTVSFMMRQPEMDEAVSKSLGKTSLGTILTASVKEFKRYSDE